MRISSTLVLLFCGLAAQAQEFFDGFEEWNVGLPVHWLGAQTTLSIDNMQEVTGDAHSGGSAIRLWQPAQGIAHFTSEQVHLDSGNYYQIGFWAKGSGIVAPGLFDDNPWTGFLNNPTVNVNSATWEHHVGEFFCQHTTDIGELMFTLAITYGPDHLLLDDVTLALNNPPPPSALSIQEIQTPVGGTNNSPYVGTAVVTSGIVTAIGLEGYRYYIQNGTGPFSGVCVSEFTGAALQMGDSVRVTGYVSEDNGETFVGCNNGYELLASGSPIPTTELLTWPLADLEPWEGVLATVENVTCVAINSNGSWDGTVNSAADLRIGVLFYTSAAAQGSTYNVTGILHYEWPIERIEPRVTEDLLEVVGIEERAFGSLRVHPNPASDVLHIALAPAQNGARYTITDVTGRSVMTDRLTSGPLHVGRLLNGLYTLTIWNDVDVRQTRFEVLH